MICKHAAEHLKCVHILLQYVYIRKHFVAVTLTVHTYPATRQAVSTNFWKYSTEWKLLKMQRIWIRVGALKPQRFDNDDVNRWNLIYLTLNCGLQFTISIRKQLEPLRPHPMGMLTFQASRAVSNALWDRLGANKVSSVVRCCKYPYISRIRAKFSLKSH